MGQARQIDWSENFHIAGSIGAIHLDHNGISLVSERRMHVLAEAEKVQLKCEGREYALREFR